MKKKIIALSAVVIVLLGAGVGTAIFSSYGQVTGYATVEQALKLDIMGSSNDLNYTMGAKQGETKYSPEIKLVNSADVPIELNITVQTVSGGTAEDVQVSVVNDGQNTTLTNPVSVPTSDAYIYIKHEFDSAANVGEYTFRVEAIPA